jgi:hypothetical protein
MSLSDQINSYLELDGRSEVPPSSLILSKVFVRLAKLQTTL